MKKWMIVLLAAVLALPMMADESVAVGFWKDCPNRIGSTDVDGLGVGLPVIYNRDMEGASLALCGNISRKVSGFQGVWIGVNMADSLYGLQLGMVNIQKGQHDDAAVQWGFYNQAGKNGVQIGFINNGENNATFQLGLVNINKNGLLPVMIFVNFGSDLFD